MTYVNALIVVASFVLQIAGSAYATVLYFRYDRSTGWRNLAIAFGFSLLRRLLHVFAYVLPDPEPAWSAWVNVVALPGLISLFSFMGLRSLYADYVRGMARQSFLRRKHGCDARSRGATASAA